MYVCICNALTERDVERAATTHGAARSGQVFRACNTRVQCGTCVYALTELAQRALGAAGAAPGLSGAPDPAADRLRAAA